MPQVTVDDGVSLYYRTLGEGERTVVLVHGWWLSGVLWDDVAPRLARVGVRVVVPDLRGAGSSDKPERGYGVDRHARDLVALLDDLGARAPVLVGHSLGGLYAQYLAGSWPDRLGALALVCPLAVDGMEVPPEIELLFRAGATDADARRTMLTLSTRTLSEERIDRLLQAGAATHPRAYKEAFDSLRRSRFAEILPAIRVPTLVVSADDAYAPDAMLRERVTGRIKAARQVLLPGSGHYLPAERPEELAAVLGAFLGGLG